MQDKDLARNNLTKLRNSYPQQLSPCVWLSLIGLLI